MPLPEAANFEAQRVVSNSVLMAQGGRSRRVSRPHAQTERWGPALPHADSRSWSARFSFPLFQGLHKQCAILRISGLRSEASRKAAAAAAKSEDCRASRPRLKG